MMRDERDGRAGFALFVILLMVGIIWAAAQRATRPVIRQPGDEPTRSTMRFVDQTLPDMRLELNHATAAELALLPGIGPRLAERIVNDRQDHGPFRTVDDLQRVHGIGPIKAERIKPYVVIDDAPDQ
jgi:competence ComEA-like helix-hairpin-helix protein